MITSVPQLHVERLNWGEEGTWNQHWLTAKYVLDTCILPLGSALQPSCDVS